MNLSLILFDDIDIVEPLKKHLSEKLNLDVYVSSSEYPVCRKRGEQLDARDFLPKIAELKEELALGLVDKDLFVPELNFVFGLASEAERTAIVSLARLHSSNRKLFIDRTIKECVHELGHLFGFGHCQDIRCVMHFSNCLEDTDIKGKDFCDRCNKII